MEEKMTAKTISKALRGRRADIAAANKKFDWDCDIAARKHALAKPMHAAVDRVFDDLLRRLDCEDGRTANLICHWQDGSNPGYRIQVSRKEDGKTLTKFVSQTGVIGV
jgi:hypothetical protein